MIYIKTIATFYVHHLISVYQKGQILIVLDTKGLNISKSEISTQP